MKIFALALLLSAATAGAATLEPLWTTKGLSNPESIIEIDGALYVSNVAGEGDAKDGKGFISKLGRDGSIETLSWVDGLDAPKGLAAEAGRLFVSDVTSLVEIDLATANIVQKHAIPDAVFLNDVAIARDGAVLVADSGKARISALKNGQVETWLEDPALRSVNGLLPEEKRLVVTTMQGKLLAVDWQTRAITTLAENLGNADGVAPLADGHYLVGEWPGRLFDVAPDGTHVVVRDTREAKEYQNDFIRLGDELLVPNWEPSTLRAYRIAR